MTAEQAFFLHDEIQKAKNCWQEVFILVHVIHTVTMRAHAASHVLSMPRTPVPPSVDDQEFVNPLEREGIVDDDESADAYETDLNRAM